MKKILASLIAVSILSSAAFAKNFFSQRYFEMRYGADVDFSNNLFALNDFMKKDLVIDLNKIADECPDNGFNIRADAAPTVAMNVNVGDVHVGLSSGIQLYENMSVGQDLFKFLGYGNEIGQQLDFSFTDDADVFAFSQLNVGFKVGRLKFKFQPAVFIPVLSIRGGGGSLKVQNDEDGTLKIGMDLNMNVYSAVELKSKEGENGISVDSSNIASSIASGYGFDLGGAVSYNLTKSLAFDVAYHIPLVPGHLNYLSTITGGFDYEIKLTDYENAKKTERETTVTNEKKTLDVHRPLKLNLYADKDMLGGLFNARAGAGFGVRRPFSDDADFYPEYYFSFGLNLIDMLKVGVSTEYTDQLFVHQLGTTFNVRLIQLDLGISTQSSSFIKSMSVAGMGAYVYVTFGF